MISINCDLGEWESLEETEWMMQRIDLANVACGTHAGSSEQMVKIAQFGEKYNVHLGMHPGHPTNGGRGDVSGISTCEFFDLLESQYLIFEKFIGKPHHIKLHGSLYHLTESSEEFAKAHISFCEELSLPIMALAGGLVLNLTKGKSYAEAFLDRNYNSNGSLVSRSEPHAMIEDVETATERFSNLKAGGSIISFTGNVLELDVDTLCVHSDSRICREVLSKLAQ